MFLIPAFLLFSAGVRAQTLDANALCLHNGGDAYVNVGDYWSPNEAGGKYFPSFTHFPCTPSQTAGTLFPWKIRGWSWTGLQAWVQGPTWYWKSCLHRSVDNPYSSNMSFDYPALICNGTVPPSGPPHPIYGAVLPHYFPAVGGDGFMFPSSAGAGMWGAYFNIFAAVAASWMIPSTQPFYGYDFGLLLAPSAAPLTVPSDSSVWEYVWTSKGPLRHYLVISTDELDCMGMPGNKGRSYSIHGQTDWG